MKTSPLVGASAASGMAAIALVLTAFYVGLSLTNAGALTLTDGPWTLPFLLVETGEYAPGYSHRGFRAVRVGMTEEEVIRLLGRPFGQQWRYDNPVVELGGETWLSFNEDGTVHPAMPGTRRFAGVSMAVASTVLPAPDEVSWSYTRLNDPDHFAYRFRVVRFRQGRVVGRRSGLDFD